MANRDVTEESEGGGSSPGIGGQAARFVAIVGVNAALVVAGVVLGSSEHGKLPQLDTGTLMVDLLPISAAFGLLVACRRIDFSLPALVALAAVLRTHPSILPGDPTTRLAIVCAITAGVGLLSSFITWYGRISSSLWTALLAVGLWFFARSFADSHLHQGTGWAWPAAVAGALGILAVGAALLGAVRLVDLPSLPPILGVGTKGFPSLACVWIIAGLAAGVLAQWDAAGALPGNPPSAYPPMLAAGALSGAYILRGRWGALAAVVLTAMAHLAWAFLWSADLDRGAIDWIIPSAAPLVAVPAYLVIDAAIRAKTGESPPTGLLA